MNSPDLRYAYKVKKRSFELLIVLALVVIATGLLKSDRGKDANHCSGVPSNSCLR